MLSPIDKSLLRPDTMSMTYTVRTHNHGIDNPDVTVNATDPDEALTMVERSGVDYTEALVEDEQGQQVALYGPDEDA